jgi:hypothetical protein
MITFALFFMHIEQILTEQLGLEASIASLFAGRALPGNNEYWSNRREYVSLSTGYIFIPVFFDLLAKRGLPTSTILSEDLLLVMEDILQSAGRMEYGRITSSQHIADCRQTLIHAGVGEGQIMRAEEQLIQRPFTVIPQRFTALKRANTFLYTFAGRRIDFELVFNSWEMILPLLLILDDFTDLAEDQASGEENCLLDGGNVADNFFELVGYCNQLLIELNLYNPALANYLRGLKNEATAMNMLSIFTQGSNPK